jgi:hypothetical protein
MHGLRAMAMVCAHFRTARDKTRIQKCKCSTAEYATTRAIPLSLYATVGGADFHAQTHSQTHQHLHCSAEPSSPSHTQHPCGSWLAWEQHCGSMKLRGAKMTRRLAQREAKESVCVTCTSGMSLGGPMVSRSGDDCRRPPLQRENSLVTRPSWPTASVQVRARTADKVKVTRPTFETRRRGEPERMPLCASPGPWAVFKACIGCLQHTCFPYPEMLIEPAMQTKNQRRRTTNSYGNYVATTRAPINRLLEAWRGSL